MAEKKFGPDRFDFGSTGADTDADADAEAPFLLSFRLPSVRAISIRFAPTTAPEAGLKTIGNSGTEVILYFGKKKYFRN